MAMRGDDVIGMILDPATQRLRFLKTEAKSRIDLRAQTLQERARRLDKDGGLPSSHALSFISARLMDGTDAPLVDAIDEALYRHGIPPDHVRHLLFTFSWQRAGGTADAGAAGLSRPDRTVGQGCTWTEHAAFVGAVTLR
jgi:hypothetical protein